MMDWYMPRASSFAGDIDGLVWLVTLMVGFWFIVAEGVFFWLIFRFREREGVPTQYMTGTKPHHKRWVTIPHLLVLLCDVVIIVAAVRVWVLIKQNLPPADQTVRVVGQQWTWAFVHPGADGRLDTADDIRTSDDLHVQHDKTYHFELESRDVLHSFSVPVFRLKQDAVPGRTIVGWFKPIRTGSYDIQCAEMCGIGHGVMGARIHVETAQQHAAWIASRAGAAAPLASATPPPAAPAAATPTTPAATPAGATH
jgi:cytochrome c oxidase subunit 2